MVFAANTGSVLTGCSDNKSNSYTPMVSEAGGGGFYCVNATAGVTTVTVVGGAHLCVLVCEESGLAAFDANAAILVNASANPELSNAITPGSSTAIGYTYFINDTSSFGTTTWTFNNNGGSTWGGITGTGITGGSVSSAGNCGVFAGRDSIASTASTFASVNVGATRSEHVGFITFTQSAGGGASGPAPMYYQRKVLYFI